MVPCPVFPPPPWDGGGMMPLWWCIYIHTYIPTYLHTYVHTYIHTITLPYITLPYIPYIHTYHYITLPYITLPYLTLPYLTFHTYIHRYIHTYIPTYQHTNIPTYHHHRPQGGGPEEPYHHHRPKGGGPEEPYHHHRPQGGGPEEPDDTVHPYPLVGGGGGVANAAPYIYIICFSWWNHHFYCVFFPNAPHLGVVWGLGSFFSVSPGERQQPQQIFYGFHWGFLEKSMGDLQDPTNGATLVPYKTIWIVGIFPEI